jgi:hypothetical protein
VTGGSQALDACLVPYWSTYYYHFIIRSPHNASAYFSSNPLLLLQPRTRSRSSLTLYIKGSQYTFTVCNCSVESVVISSIPSERQSEYQSYATRRGKDLNLHCRQTKHSIEPFRSASIAFSQSHWYGDTPMIIIQHKGSYCRHLCGWWRYVGNLPSLNGHWMFPECSLNIHWMFPVCSLSVHWVFAECSLYVHWMSTLCWLDVHYVFKGRQSLRG